MANIKYSKKVCMTLHEHKLELNTSQSFVREKKQTSDTDECHACSPDSRSKGLLSCAMSPRLQAVVWCQMTSCGAVPLSSMMWNDFGWRKRKSSPFWAENHAGGLRIKLMGSPPAYFPQNTHRHRRFIHHYFSKISTPETPPNGMKIQWDESQRSGCVLAFLCFGCSIYILVSHFVICCVFAFCTSRMRHVFKLDLDPPQTTTMALQDPLKTRMKLQVSH